MERPQDPGRASDEELLGRIAVLEPAALGELYDRHGATVYSLARRMVGSDRAEDAVQEAFLAVWRGARRYEAARGTARSWLLALVRNRCIDVLRRTAAEERRNLELERAEHTLPPTKAIDDAVVDGEDGARVRSALRELTAERREVLELAYFGGWTQTEIAERLAVPVGTVKSRTRAALEQLRDALEPQPDAAG